MPTSPATRRPVTEHVALRPVTEADRDFLVELYGSTRDEELSQVPWRPGQREAFVLMQFEAQDSEYRRVNPQGSFDVIVVLRKAAGRLYVDRKPDEIRLVDIALLPEFRGAGVGTFLIGRLQAEAAESGRILSMHVEIHNRAAGLYDRLGFVVTEEQGLYRRMEWRTS